MKKILKKTIKKVVTLKVSKSTARRVAIQKADVVPMSDPVAEIVSPLEVADVTCVTCKGSGRISDKESCEQCKGTGINK